MADEDVETPTEITFHNIKSNLFRVAFVDGGIVGVTPGMMIHCAFFNQRPAIAQQETHAVKPGGGLGERKAVVTRSGIVREIEIETIMTVETAKVIRDLLTQKIDQLEQLQNKLAKKRGIPSV